MIRHGRHVPSQCPKQKHFPPVLVAIFNVSRKSPPGNIKNAYTASMFPRLPRATAFILHEYTELLLHSDTRKL